MEIREALLSVNEYSRPGIKLGKVAGVVIHWVGNAKSTAINNRHYFEGLKAGTNKTYASSHYIVGLDGEVVRCIPEDEVAYHAKQANSNHIGIEVCHEDWTGKFSETTLNTLIELVSELCKKYGLNPMTQVKRHYDITGKDCPKYYVEHKEEWLKLKEAIRDYKKVETPPWYEESFRWCEKEGLMGYERPKDSLTRAEMASILYKLHNKGIL